MDYCHLGRAIIKLWPARQRQITARTSRSDYFIKALLNIVSFDSADFVLLFIGVVTVLFQNRFSAADPLFFDQINILSRQILGYQGWLAGR